MIDWNAHVLMPLNEHFGEKIYYRPQNKKSFEAVGIYDEAYREIASIGEGVAMSTDQPTIGICTGHLKGHIPIEGDQITIDRTGETFEVNSVRSDGHGDYRLMLNLVEGDTDAV